MRDTLTIFGAWIVIFPVAAVVTIFASIVGLLARLFHMPVELWNELKEELENIHRG